MRRIAFVTCEAEPDLAEDDRIAATALADRGVVVRPLPWTEPTARWSEHQALVVRSTWGYHLQSARFSAWIAARCEEGVALFNPPALLAWNSDKLADAVVKPAVSASAWGTHRVRDGAVPPESSLETRSPATLTRCRGVRPGAALALLFAPQLRHSAGASAQRMHTRARGFVNASGRWAPRVRRDRGLFDLG